ncbi:MAG: HAD family phosphatase [Planctomycetes bacterium]|nr:HAD family phosphatase [Planctomycetota bacterium]
MLNITTVIFDLGRVMVTIRTSGPRWQKLMHSVGIDPDKAFERFSLTHEVRSHMTGELDSHAFYRLLCEKMGLQATFEEFAEAWCDLFSPMDGMVELFEKVAERHRVGILSDTDPLHWSCIRAMLPCLEKVKKPTLSYNVGYLKPHPAMFETAAKNCATRKEHCLFIDDVIHNVNGARHYGMPAIRFTNAKKLAKDLALARIL